MILEKGLEFCRVNVLEDPVNDAETPVFIWTVISYIQFIQYVFKSFDVWSVPKIGRRFSNNLRYYFSFMILSED